ncbi:hypothetical protein E2P47_03350 [Candidatus Bathyarchaeota archaeon]|nr:hypothetical protein E2P47_03350 [Candidatus Bathyarchaeota archaeon]
MLNPSCIFVTRESVRKTYTGESEDDYRINVIYYYDIIESKSKIPKLTLIKIKESISQIILFSYIQTR